MAFNDIVINKVRHLVDAEKYFPDFVFFERWNEFLFFDSDWLFDAEFIECVKKVLMLEQSEFACIVNIDQIGIENAASDASFCFDNSTVNASYKEVLTGGNKKLGWVYGVDRYACSSDHGGWCIYCEKRNDLAVISFRDNILSDARNIFIEYLKAVPLKKANEESNIYGLSEKVLTEEWKKILYAKYSG